MPTARRAAALLSLCLVVLATSAGCGGGETCDDVIAKNKPRFGQIRADLKAIAAEVDKPEALATSVPANLDPKIVYDERGKRSNTAFLGYEQLADPDKRPAFDLAALSELRTCLAWTGPNNPLHPDVRDDPADDMPQIFERAAATRYLVVYKLTRHEPVQAVGEDGFTGGEAAFDVFVVDLPAKKVLGSLGQIAVRAPDNTKFTWKQGDDRAERMRSAAHSTMWTAARAELKKVMADTTGAEIAFD